MSGGEKPSRIAPGLLRQPVPEFKAEGAKSDGIPLSLTDDDQHPTPVGILLPSGDTPWGCLFLILVASTVLIAIFSSRAATVVCLVGLIVLYGFLNHPRRRAADGVRRALRLVGVRKSKRAREALTVSLRHQPDDEGIHYLASLVELYDGNPAEALEHLAMAERKLGRYAEFHHLTGRCLALAGDPESARSSLEKAMEYGAYPARSLLVQELAALDSQFNDDDLNPK